jgi:3-methyladenine DNA glycosylase/8-oxoguanine DNA glycosylase
MATKLSLELPLIGPAGEPVNLRRTLIGHGVTTLAPAQVDEELAVFDITLPLPGYGVRAMRIESGNPGFARITGWDLPDTPETRAALEQAARWLMRMETNLSPLYEAARTDPDLAWITIGAGRMGRCNTVFEDVIKTVLTTNCAWSATIRMVTALVQNLGAPAPVIEEFTPHRAFPTPEAMAEKDETFYREVVRAGYRAKPLRAIAAMVASGAIDLERMAVASPSELPDDEMRAELLALPGVGPYAAAHAMMMIGRPSRLILDSSTRPKYAKLTGSAASDAEIEARFAPYGDYAGLAFWLFVTRDWFPEES